MKQILDALGLGQDNPGAWSPVSGWSTTTDQGVIESINPTTGALIARVYNPSADDIERVTAESREVFESFRAMPAPLRGELVRKVNEALREHKDALGSLVTLEMGKIKAEGDGEVQEMIDIGDFAVGQSRMLYGQTMHSERPRHRMYEQWHPLGVVGVISAFNFPVAVWSWNAFIAAICGDVTIWKPSPKAPLCAVAIQHIINRVLEAEGLPGVFSFFVHADNAASERFVRDTRVDMISFTGSCAVGKRVGVMVAERMGRSLLELGGNNAIIVDESADLGLAIPGIAFGAVGTAGQRCTSTRRVFVHESLFESVAETLAKAYGQIRIGDPLLPDTLMGPLIDEDSVQRYSDAVAAIRAAGGEILCGGEAIEGAGNFVQPTLVCGLSNDHEMVQTETFAPILYLLPFSDFEQVMAMQNGVAQGLSSSIFTNDMRHAERFLAATGSDCGIANVNIGTSGAEIGGAFGGEKETGGGRESGSDSWKAYMRRQTNTINWGSDLPLAQGIKFEV
jgi:L-aminoadipate-semialdehyde dehydrogenase